MNRHSLIYIDLHPEPVRTDTMFDVQYNRNTFNPHLRKSWQHAHRADTLEGARLYLRTTRAKFKNEFGYPSDVEYRIVEVEKVQP